MAQSVAPILPDSSARPLARALPPGWRVVGSARDLPCHVLAHAAEGVILLDIAERGSAGAEARLGATMAAAGLRPGGLCPLPVWYMRIEPPQIPRLEALLTDALAAQGFATDRPQTAWIDALGRALRTDPAWGGRRARRRPRPLQAVSRHPATMAAMLALAVAGFLGWLGLDMLAGMGTDRAPKVEEVAAAPCRGRLR